MANSQDEYLTERDGDTFMLRLIDGRAADGSPLGGFPCVLAKDREVIIGRKGADVLLPLDGISRAHAKLRYLRDENTFELTDLESRNGTFLEARQIEAGVGHKLTEGQIIQIGRAHLMLERISDSDGTAGDTASMPAHEAVEAVVSASPAKEKPVGAAAAQELDQDRARQVIRDIQGILHARVDFAKVVKQAADDDQAKEVVQQQIGYVINELYSQGRIRKHEIRAFEKQADDDILGYGPIQDLMDDHAVSEIMVNGPNQIYYEQSGKLKVTQRKFLNEEHCQQILRRLLKGTSRRVDEASPRVNATLPDGSRLHGIIPPLALSGTTITIRKFHHSLSVDKLVDYGALTKPMGDFLRLACQERMNIIVSGGTGSGKTTLLNALSTFIQDDHRMITIEDTAELALTQPHVVRLQSRPPNAEGVGGVSIRELVVEALRMRPDRIIVGECRHAEALDMLQAMNTGHDGSLTTIHSNSAKDGLQRLETMVLMAGLELPLSAIRRQIQSAVNFFVHTGRLMDGTRKIKEIVEITGIENGEITTQPVYRFNQTEISAEGKVIGRHEPTGYIPPFLARMQQQKKEIPPDLFSVV